MRYPASAKKPSFLWQGIFILLPVAVLAVVGIVSLRADERNAEIEARNRAAENIKSLALAIHDRVDTEYQRYLTLEDTWMTAVRAESQPYVTVDFPDATLTADLASWDRNYPALRIADSALPSVSILATGHLVDFPDIPAVPTAPRWFLQLSPLQQNLWEALAAATNLNEFRKRKELYLAAQPPLPARSVIYYLNAPPEQIVRRPLETNEMGLTYQELAWCQILTSPNAQLSPALLDAIWHLSISPSSFIGPKMLALAGSLAAKADPVTREKYQWTVYLQNRQQRVLDYLEPFRHIPDGKVWQQSPDQQWTDRDRMLVNFLPAKFNNQRVITGFERGYHVQFVSREIITAIFARALRENRILIPDYVSVELTFNGVPLLGGFPDAEHKPPLLASAEPPAQSFGAQVNLPFHLNFYLASREQMLATERDRARLSILLILGTVLVALTGWLTAWRAFRRQLQLNELKSNFVSSVSHELRAPIASVRLMAENLEGGKIPNAGKQQEYYRFIVQECRRLSSLIENVLDFARIEQGRKQYELEPTDLAALTQTTVHLLEPYAHEKGVALKLEATLQGTAPKLELNLDGRAIQQALVNLLDNAIKHSAKGQVVTIGLGQNNEQNPPIAQLWVADHGPGIPATDHEKIFERFYRRGSELRRETQGIGIGLSLVKHIVETHGGRVRVVSEPGEGSTFTIELPIVC